MNPYLVDLWNNASFVAIIVTTLVVIVVESTRAGRPALSFMLTIIGLAVTALFAAMKIGDAGASFSGMIRFGTFTSFFEILFCVSALIATLLAQQHLQKLGWNRGEYFILVLFATTGMMLMGAANDLIILFLGLELMSLCLYVLTGFIRINAKSNEAALKYFLLGAFSTGFLLYGIALIYGLTGSTNLTMVARSFPLVSENPIFLAGCGLVLIGLLFKVAAVPFHMWAPDVYEGAPTTVTAFMSTSAKSAAFASLVILFVQTFRFEAMPMNNAIAIVAAASMILGNVVAIAQTNIKRMLAYSSIAHAGYMLAGIAAGNAEAQSGVMFYLAAYCLMNLGAFGIVSLLESAEEKNLTLEDYAGLSKQRPLLAAGMALFMFSLAGIPPMAGFFGKYYVFLAAIKANLTWLAVIGVLTSLVSAYYYLRVVVMMYFRDGQADAHVPRPATLIALSISALFVLFFGLFPSVLLSLTTTIF
jgi:NADH-quinone oxidoreductase subunit N